MSFVRLLLASIVMTVCFVTFASGALEVLPNDEGVDKLPDDEVQALRDIFNTLGKKDWNFSNPCNSTHVPSTAQITTLAGMQEYAAVNCSNCVVNGIESYRVVGIDLTRNYINGSIPPAWGSVPKLAHISLLGNRLTGPIPGALSNIKTLQNLTVEFNKLSGNLPSELGNMSSLERLFLSSNYFTGELPTSFANLISLKDFRISDNQFSGQIPNYIQNWNNLNKLLIQASGLRGPIPSLDPLKQLSDLRISDLNGSEVTFPLKYIYVAQWKVLILRNCNLTGPLPETIESPLRPDFKTLDLSFNRLIGGIPDNFIRPLQLVDHIYLTGNLFTGPIPDSILHRGEYTDLSYNKFTILQGLKLSASNCQYGTGINLFASSSMDNIETSNNVSCLRSLQRSCHKRRRYKLHINCGGEKVTVNKSEFDADVDPRGYSTFFLAQHQYWSSSSTGEFMDDNRPNRDFILSNLSGLSTNTPDPELYMTARISPLSLTYYAFCLVNGNYTVKLHFAEIVFTDDETYSSLGRRIFDVYIQGERVLKDFDIVKAAGGVRKPNIQSFNATVMANGTLEIRFYWAGKGTTDIPLKGNYGPLISAISVDSHEIPSNSIPTGEVVGIIVAGVFVIILLIVAILWWKGCLGERSSATEHDLRGLDLKTGTFTLRQIKTATNNFDVANKIGEGGFGSVYKGLLSDGTMMAVKQLSSKSKQGNREFLNEIGMISALQHPHLVKLYGCCVEGNQLLLVYEYMENNSLARALFGPEEDQLQLDWPTRHRICVGIARGLAYLHEESILKIVHRDIKATNVLLDKNLNPKISDFGLAKLDDEDNSHISTRIAGTYGYMAPEYAMRGHLTDKADVYSFGIVALEIVSGKSNTSHRPKGESLHLLDWALVLKEKGNLLDLVDLRLGSNYRKEEAMRVINVALLCANVSAAVRPTMSSVVSMLEGGAVIPELGPNLSIIDDEMKVKALWEHFQDKKESSRGNSQTQSVLTDDPFTGSSTSAVDLYPINMDSSYWEKRV
ncbi:probable leucine-rich repeat receptor-like serine/threonine-protein kinase At3g14840 isoform X2 [Carya illinoinensis]|uniref:probable leucine-rich repeat receptor-like serine/threonine-protein kinase At3g14840 isoform X2 n=1 Tax=Carya illinoinensis TaxID=32201 RepID=UPI001C722E08|nr:probable leucine-rich repeat receptor-like serine/threonine-protein kinase At3g14840 isoform X2 [Carya illinoinensis]